MIGISRIKTTLAAVLVTVGLIAGATLAGPAAALQASQFTPGYIISDSVFFDANSMTVGQIQAFLEGKESPCSAINGVACLENYTMTTTSRSASSGGQCAAYAGAMAEQASLIIAKVALACGISPKVLLTLLEKEQGLVSASAPSPAAYRVATGYGCPDSGSCDTAYYGLYNQLYMAAWQFREFTIHPNSWHFRIGSYAVPYNPDTTCSAPTVDILNQATADLYNYTPYQPNAAALANLSGVGDACSAYGNRNFWVYFSNWFGSPVGYDDPVGNVDVVTAGIKGIHVSGWAFDANSAGAIQVHVYINGVGTPVVADLDRPDLAGQSGLSNTLHGFDATIPVTPAVMQHICIYAINVGAGINTEFPCVDVSGSPVGALDLVSAANGTITAAGWAIDPESAAPISVDLYVDSRGTRFTADGPRPDLLSNFPGYGSSHGFGSTSGPVSVGFHTVCLYGISVLPGGNSTISCRSIFVPDSPPIGHLDRVSLAAGNLVASGWSLDPNTLSSDIVHVYTDSAGIPVTADDSRLDVAIAFPGYGALHGFTSSSPVLAGVHTVCSYGIDTISLTSSVLGCRNVRVLAGAAIGSVDSVRSASGGITVSGWALDPDSSLTANVRIEVDATSVTIPAESSRVDLNAAFPLYGALHGFNSTIEAAPGSHLVCVFGQKIVGGAEAALGCSTVKI